MVEQQEFHADIPDKAEALKDPISPTLPDYNFDITDYESTALPSSRFSFRNLLEWSFEKMRPKGKPIKPARVKLVSPRNPVITRDPLSDLYEKSSDPIPTSSVSKGYEVRNGFLLKKKSIAEKVRDQLKFPWIKSLPSVTRGLTAITLCIGVMLIYSELSSHPRIVIGIVLVSLAASLIISNN